MSQLKIYDLATHTWKYVSSPSQMVYVSPSAPPTPYDGALWWDTDDASLLVDTVAPVTLAADPAFTSKYAPLGIEIAYAEATGAQAGFGPAITDITNATVTFVATAARKYEIKAFANIAQNTSPGIVNLYVTDNLGVVATSPGQSLVAAGYGMFTVFRRLTGLSGSVTYRLRAASTAGTLTMNQSATLPTVISVTQVG